MAAINDSIVKAVRVVIPNDGESYISHLTEQTDATSETGFTDSDDDFISEPDHSDSSLRSLWWVYKPATSGTIDFDTNDSPQADGTSGGTQDTQCAIYQVANLVDPRNNLVLVEAIGDGGLGGRSALDSIPVDGGETYYIQVGHSDPSLVSNVIITVTGPASIDEPNVPINLSVFNITSTGAGFIWEEAIDGPETIGFEYSMDSSAPVNVGLDNVVEFANMTANIAYVFHVRAVGDDGYSDWVYIEFMTAELLPAEPINVVVSSITGTSVAVDWEAGGYGPTVDRFEYSLNGLLPVSVDLANTKTLSGLIPDTSYLFHIRSVGSTGESPWVEVTFRTWGFPEAPVDLIVDEITRHTATFVWDDPTVGAPASGHEYSVNFGSPTSFGLVNELALASLLSGTEYSMRVRRINDYGESGWASVIFQTVVGEPNPPQLLTVSDSTSTSATVTWSPPNPGPPFTSYQCALDGGDIIDVDIATSVSFDDLVSGSSHTIQVRTFSSEGPSAWVYLEFTLDLPAPHAPINLEVRRITPTDSTVNWSPPTTGTSPERYEYSFNYNGVMNAELVEQIIFDGLTPDTTYNFRVRSVGPSGVSDWSETTFLTLESGDESTGSFRLEWNRVGFRGYEYGLDRGVLYLTDNSGVAWNGLVAVEEDLSDEGAEPLYMDGVKYLDAINMGDYSATLQALTYPDEFLPFEGYGSIGQGVVADDQNVDLFGLSYRSRIGTDVDENHAYKIHIVYNLTANPETKNHVTHNPDVNPVEFGWSISGVPMAVPGHRPTTHVILDSRFMNKFILRGIEDILYGNNDESARLPSLLELVGYVKDYVSLVITDNGDGTWTAAGPSDMISMIDLTTFQITEADAVFLDSDTYTIQSS